MGFSVEKLGSVLLGFSLGSVLLGVSLGSVLLGVYEQFQKANSKTIKPKNDIMRYFFI